MSIPDDEILKRLGSRLRDLRIAASMSQEELAGRAGLHRTYVGGIERGERNVAVVNLVRLARALLVDVGALMLNIDSEVE
jgi:transcriptional regulator with XRE-family HTH domain